MKWTHTDMKVAYTLIRVQTAGEGTGEYAHAEIKSQRQQAGADERGRDPG